MQKKKTGKLFNFCLYAVGTVANKNKKEKFFLKNLGEEIGLLFQLADDFLDNKGSSKLVGKLVKKDDKKNVLVFSPAFTADCLETIIEIGDEYKELFEESGGENLDYVESLNYSDLWADAIIDIIK